MSAAALRGLLRTAAYEHPELRASSVEFIEGRTPYADSVAELLDDEQPLTENRLLPEGRHVAHVVPGPDTDVPGISRPAEPLVRPGASYLVTGGMEGLGLLTVPWLARHGAGRIVTIGRSTPTPETERRLSELAATGTDILVLHGDIADPGLIRRALAMAGDAGRAVRGVLHAAGVIEDATLATLDEHLLERVWRRKAEGAWALHRATEDLALDFFALDFFVLYSSVPSLIGSRGQAAYATANAFLDGLAAHRRDHGLPATGIHWGAWRDVGRGQHLAERGFLTIVPTDGVDALERILTAGHHQVAYSPLDIAQWTASYPALSTSTLLAPLLTGQEATQDETEVRDRLLGAEGPAARQDILETFIIDFETTQVPETERELRRMVSRLKRQFKDQRALIEEL